MRKFTRRGMLGMASVAMMLMVSACGGTTTDSSDAATTAKPQGNDTSASSKTKVVWWHSMGGALGKEVDQLVADFNKSQDKVQVEAVFQGTYDESINKMKASMDSDSGPSMIQVYEIGSRFMIDSKAITPVQQFIDQDKYDVSQLEENITRYYTFDGKQYSMPFNTSNPILYYNKDLFKAAGLDPEKPPTTYEEVKKDAEVLSKQGHPASFAIYGWFMEQLFANQGKEYLNNGNGRTSPATQSLVNSEAGVKTLEWWKSMIDNKSVINLGRKTDDTEKAFIAGQIAMTLDSTASLREIVDGSDGKFKVGTAFLPKPQSASDGGVVVGGASLWILNNKPEAEQKAAWEFIKYLAEPTTQAKWHIATGYFPITKKAYDEQIVKDNLTKYPQFQTAIDQLHASKPSTATQGAVMGVFPEARQTVEGAIEEVLSGSKPPQKALDDAAKTITDKIGTYNKTVQK
ncbi:sn-glycerol 3-phosphate transport system substrate-binding protein [Paenibacillus shirakamiensis]|uniref:Sn-glycerol 3-phosphate transport system substrate-binding protein n=1 Tax=Paenibacillus shirakamiensis TaxID=1265935 RepID=A0ABS4JHN6_9BACL|nr:ABC transporter substrate-binding protein [Paenibacillus shirakamiensis]MBP2001237.1 sn-glycerol 3-phosphate transport system substrate-binding protein [Paenibacillus shirakamiensis]